MRTLSFFAGFLRPCLVRGGALLLALPLLAACAREPYAPADARSSAQATRPLPLRVDSVGQLAAGRHYNQHGRLYRAFLGAHYRRVWAAPVTAPVLNLARATPEGRALRPHRAGGGFQSISLSLRADDGREFALRALDKDPRKTLPTWLQKTFLLNAVRDATTAANPYGAFTVAPLAAAVGVVPTHPRLVYVRPDETGLGEISGHFQGRLALLEEKHAGPAGQIPALAGATALLDSKDMLRQLYADPRRRLDQPAFLRARLLDVWLGDWDRHEGQWNWAAFAEKNGRTRFQALPKDRDQVYFRFDDGLVPWLLSRLMPRFQTFGPRYKNVRGLVQQAAFIDERGLNGCTRTDFQRAAARLQQQLPDTLITRALRRLPPTVYALEGPATAAALRARRAALPAAAEVFYRGLARRPVVGGTARAERFVVRRWADSVTVAVYAPGLGADSLLYRRAFFAHETTQITLEGLAGNDVFEVQTAGSRRATRIRLLVVGGAGNDQLNTNGPLRRVLFYDEPGLISPARSPATAATGAAVRARPLPPRHRPYDRPTDK